jgi:Kef-type K+ transport system membrane component KefB
MKLGVKFWFVLIGTAIGAVIAGAVLIAIFGWAWYAWGFAGAFLALSAILLSIGWLYDRREQNRRKQLAA